MNQKTSQQLALDAEKIFSSESLLLVTFHEQELNRSAIKQLHSDIKNVHILHPIFIPKRRCIIEIEKKSDINVIKSTLNKKQYDTGYITVDFIKNYKETNKNIDPCTLYVRNLPANVTNRDIEILYPTCMKYKFLSSLENSKSVLVHFHNAEDAVIAYKSTNNIFYQSNLLMVQFNRRGLKVNPLVCSNETIEIDDEFDDELKEDDVDHESSDEDAYIDDEFINSDDFDYDDFGQGNTTHISQENNNVTDTLHVQNLPSNISDDELLDLYPNCHEYRFLPLKSSRSKSALVRFHSAKDASVAHTDTDNIIYKSHTLYVQFYRKNNDTYAASNKPEVINLDVSDDENECSIINNEVGNEEHNNSGLRGENISQKKAKVNNKINVRPGRPADVENVKNQDLFASSEENIDPQVLHVENLPFLATGEDLVKLYPACREYQILREKSQTTVSALIYFNTVHDAKEAYNSTSNTVYKSRVLSVKFRCKTLNINPLAVMKRKTNHFHEKKDFSSSSSSSKKLKSACDNNRRTNSTDEEDVILVGQALKTGHMEEMKEDDVEYKSEEEEYIDDFGVDPEIDNDDYEEDAIEDDEDQDMELDENDTFLPHDEDDE